MCCENNDYMPCSSPPCVNYQSTCPEASWPDKRYKTRCGEYRYCDTGKVWVYRFSSRYKSCNKYCETVGRICTSAWEQKDDDCEVKSQMTCDQETDSSDVMCECL